MQRSHVRDAFGQQQRVWRGDYLYRARCSAFARDGNLDGDFGGRRNKIWRGDDHGHCSSGDRGERCTAKRDGAGFGGHARLYGYGDERHAEPGRDLGAVWSRLQWRGVRDAFEQCERVWRGDYVFGADGSAIAWYGYVDGYFGYGRHEVRRRDDHRGGVCGEYFRGAHTQARGIDAGAGVESYRHSNQRCRRGRSDVVGDGRRHV